MKFKFIEGYDNYIITSTGEVHSIKNKIRLKPWVWRGYEQVILYKNGKRKKKKVHRLVAQAFIPNTENKPEVNHINENKSDNCVKNLNWMTSKENSNWGSGIERQAMKTSGKNNYNSKHKEYYSTKTTTRSGFKTICRHQNWNFDDFVEIYSGEKAKNYIKKYYYCVVI